tara:strand:- start:242 stop:1048 length:807 start_codon:yes stop_codon:yes gene_type:complete
MKKFAAGKPIIQKIYKHKEEIGRALPTALILILLILLVKQCESTQLDKLEITRLENNNLALQDTIRNYVSKDGLNTGEIRALNLKVDELNDSLDYEKSKPPVTITEYKVQIQEKIVEVPNLVVLTDTLHDTVYRERGYTHLICVQSDTVYDKSLRRMDITIPANVSDSLTLGSAEIDLYQNIWLRTSIYQDRKTKEVFMRAETDYPNVTFNQGTGILVQDDKGLKQLMRQSRRTFGIGIQTGVGVTTTGQARHYIGVGIHYSPKFLQW